MHLLKRMIDRDFTEVGLRHMLEYAARLRVIVEPDDEVQLIVVVTAYPVI